MQNQDKQYEQCYDKTHLEHSLEYPSNGTWTRLGTLAQGSSDNLRSGDDNLGLDDHNLGSGHNGSLAWTGSKRPRISRQREGKKGSEEGDFTHFGYL